MSAVDALPETIDDVEPRTLAERSHVLLVRMALSAAGGDFRGRRSLLEAAADIVGLLKFNLARIAPVAVVASDPRLPVEVGRDVREIDEEVPPVRFPQPRISVTRDAGTFVEGLLLPQRCCGENRGREQERQ
jgi:hypothetical protein